MHTGERSFAALLNVYALFLFRQSKKASGILWSVEEFLTFLKGRILNKYCLWEANFLYVGICFDVANSIFIVKNNS